MSYGLLATDITSARDLADRLRTDAAVAAGTGRAVGSGGDMVFGTAASALARVVTEATSWRTTAHDVVRALATGIDVAADDTERADAG